MRPAKCEAKAKAAIYIIKGVMFVCHDLCSVWPAKQLGRSRPNLTHALMSTQGVFLARSMSRSFTYACWTDRSTKHPESDTWRTMLKLRQDDGGGDTCRTITKLRSSRNEALRRAASANGASRTLSGGRVIRASKLLIWIHLNSRNIAIEVMIVSNDSVNAITLPYVWQLTDNYVYTYYLQTNTLSQMVTIHSWPDFDDLPRSQPKWERGWGQILQGRGQKNWPRPCWPRGLNIPESDDHENL